MVKINITPLSVNKAWQGRRFKTADYKNYEATVLMMLPKIKIPEPYFKINIELGFSSKLADIDNPVKMILDILQKKYKFNDRDIHELNLSKRIVKKGKEYFKFNIEHTELLF